MLKKTLEIGMYACMFVVINIVVALAVRLGMTSTGSQVVARVNATCTYSSVDAGRRG